MQAKIERSGMDGQGRHELVSTDIVWPNGLTLDYPLQTVYWVDASLDRLERINMDGTKRTVRVKSDDSSLIYLFLYFWLHK